MGVRVWWWGGVRVCVVCVVSRYGVWCVCEIYVVCVCVVCEYMCVSV